MLLEVLLSRWLDATRHLCLTLLSYADMTPIIVRIAPFFPVWLVELLDLQECGVSPGEGGTPMSRLRAISHFGGRATAITEIRSMCLSNLA